MVEPEIAFAELKDVMDLSEDMLKYIIQFVMEHAPEEMEFFNNFVEKDLFNKLVNIVNSDFAQITYTEAIDLLKKADVKFDYPVEWGCDLQTEHERYITEKIFNKPVFVTDYPKEIKAFYMRQMTMENCCSYGFISSRSRRNHWGSQEKKDLNFYKKN